MSSFKPSFHQLRGKTSQLNLTRTLNESNQRRKINSLIKQLKKGPKYKLNGEKSGVSETSTMKNNQGRLMTDKIILSAHKNN